MGETGAKETGQAAEVAENLVVELALLGDIGNRKMFGGYGIFESGKMFALINSQGEIYLKVDDSNRERFTEAGSEKHGRMPYYRLPDEVLADSDALAAWAMDSITIAHQ